MFNLHIREWPIFTTQFMVVLALFTLASVALTLFLPSQLLKNNELNQVLDLRTRYGGALVIGAALLFIISFSTLCVRTASFLIERFRMHRVFENLTDSERAYLNRFLTEGERTIEYGGGDIPILEALVNLEILEPRVEVRGRPNYEGNKAYTMQPWAWVHLNRNPRLLQQKQEP